ncbi:MAG TPA: hypothetical protein PKM91_16460 [Cyclobacteriaceae bacterium]|nr:hypothetical protein [Cyclobacteriaceae bacterium]
MSVLVTPFKSGGALSPRSIRQWRLAQGLVWVVGFTIFACLVFLPDLGILLFWNILIPIAPALIVLAVGLWRNICPLASTALLPRHLGISRQKKMSIETQGILILLSVLLLYIIVPLRHPVFNVSGHATAWLLAGTTLVAVTLGFFFEWKSAWCSTLCPVHPVERLYGTKVMGALPNAHCTACEKCVVPCPDSTPNLDPRGSQKTAPHRLAGLLITGGLPGFIWGWFHEADGTPVVSFLSWAGIYYMPLLGMLITLALYALLTTRFRGKQERMVTAVFATAAVSCYYWYRIPSLLGFGKFPDDGCLIDMRDYLNATTVSGISIGLTLFFFWWLVIRKPNKSSWVIRPEYA